MIRVYETIVRADVGKHLSALTNLDWTVNDEKMSGVDVDRRLRSHCENRPRIQMHNASMNDLMKIFDIADKALYSAKRNSKNRVELALTG
jgi:GGDEF domain-containing protein